MWEFLFYNIPLDLSQYAIFFLEVVYPVSIFNDLAHLTVEARPEQLAEPRTLTSNSCETPKEHGHILDLVIFVVLFNRLAHHVDERNGWKTKTGQCVYQHDCRTYVVLIEISLNC